MSKRILVLAFLVSAGLFVVSCGKKGDHPEGSHDHPAQEKSEHPEMSDHAASEHPEKTESENTLTNKVCPVMGNPAQKEFSVEYKGKKIYFCCSGCDKVFLKDPDKYMSKLK